MIKTLQLQSVSRLFFGAVALVLLVNLSLLALIASAGRSSQSALQRFGEAHTVIDRLVDETHLLNQAVMGYLQTGRVHYLDVYFAITEVRTGEREGPKADDPVRYWRDLLALNQPPEVPQGQVARSNDSLSFVNRLRQLQFRPGEVEAAQRFMTLAEQMQGEEKVAFAIAEGLYNPATRAFTDAKPDRAAALARLYAPSYIALQHKMGGAIQAFVSLVSERVAADSRKAEDDLQRWVILAFAINVLLLPLVFGAAVVVRSRVLDPIRTLVWQAGEFLRGQYRARPSTELATVHEVHVLSNTLNAMSNAIDDDLRRRDRAQRELAQARDAAEVADRAKSAFLANMSHEIRTPLNAILGMAALAMQTPLNPQQRDYLEKVTSASEHLLALINDVLDFSKIEAGRMTLEQTPFALEEVVNRAVSLVRQQAHDKDLELLCDFADGALIGAGGHVRGDPLRLGQVLANLLSNAVKFTSVGHVTLTVDTDAQAVVVDNQVALEFMVRDSGIGMSEAQIASLFTEFSQADTSTTRRFGGTGLGLSISKRLVELMGGRIEVSSTVNEGSVFAVRLRLPTLDAPGPTITLKDVDRLRVLVVEDHAMTTRVLTQLLARLGVGTTGTIRAVHTARAAMDELTQAESEAKPFDLLLLDWILPDMEGEVVLRHLASLRSRPRTVLASAYLSPAIVETASKYGCTEHLEKPILPRELIRLWQPAEPQSRERAGDSLRLDGMRVLLVEDNALNRQLALELLRQRGAKLSTALDGAEAVERLVHDGPQAFDIVLMDLQMPVMDGIEATRRIRERTEFNALPIVAMTANVLPEERERCLSVGMQGHVPKPFRLNELVALMRRLAPDAAPTATRGTGAPNDPRQAIASVYNPNWVEAPSEPLPAPNRVSAWLNSSDLTGLTGHRGASAPAASAPSQAAFDLSVLLEHCMDDNELASQVLTGISADYSAGLAEWRQWLADGQWTPLVRAAHTLKGLAGTLGASRMREAALALEHMARSQQLADAHAMLDRLSVDLQQVLADIPAAQQHLAHSGLANASPAALDPDLKSFARLIRDSDATAVQWWGLNSLKATDTLGRKATHQIDSALARLDFDAVRLALERAGVTESVTTPNTLR